MWLLSRKGVRRGLRAWNGILQSNAFRRRLRRREEDAIELTTFAAKSFAPFDRLLARSLARYCIGRTAILICIDGADGADGADGQKTTIQL